MNSLSFQLWTEGKLIKHGIKRKRGIDFIIYNKNTISEYIKTIKDFIFKVVKINCTCICICKHICICI